MLFDEPSGEAGTEEDKEPADEGECGGDEQQQIPEERSRMYNTRIKSSKGNSPKPQDHEDLLVENVDDKDALNRVFLNVGHLSHLNISGAL